VQSMCQAGMTDRQLTGSQLSTIVHKFTISLSSSFCYNLWLTWSDQAAGAQVAAVGSEICLFGFTKKEAGGGGCTG
jgi:hypothetical protein